MRKFPTRKSYVKSFYLRKEEVQWYIIELPLYNKKYFETFGIALSTTCLEIFALNETMPCRLRKPHLNHTFPLKFITKTAVDRLPEYATSNLSYYHRSENISLHDACYRSLPRLCTLADLLTIKWISEFE